VRHHLELIRPYREIIIVSLERRLELRVRGLTQSRYFVVILVLVKWCMYAIVFASDHETVLRLELLRVNAAHPLNCSAHSRLDSSVLVDRRHCLAPLCGRARGQGYVRQPGQDLCYSSVLLSLLL